jgi:hypothetical protein
MPLANYTTEVSAETTIGEIQKLLRKHGAIQILLDVKGAETLGVSFLIATSKGTLPFKLPAEVDKTAQILLAMRKNKPQTWQYDYKTAMLRINEQARRVAWRTIYNWLVQQLAMIEINQVTLQQVFLPYLMVNSKNNLYEIMEHKGYFLGEGKTQDGDFHEI